MSSPSGPSFFVSYNRANIAMLRRIVAELRKRGVNAWVDTENLIPALGPGSTRSSVPASTLP